MALLIDWPVNLSYAAWTSDQIWVTGTGTLHEHPLIARFKGSTWGPSGADRIQVGPMLAPWTLLSGSWHLTSSETRLLFQQRLQADNKGTSKVHIQPTSQKGSIWESTSIWRRQNKPCLGNNWLAWLCIFGIQTLPLSVMLSEPRRRNSGATEIPDPHTINVLKYHILTNVRIILRFRNKQTTGTCWYPHGLFRHTWN